MPKYIIDIPKDRVTSDGKLRFMACIDSPLANWIYTGIFAEPFDCKAIEDEVWEFCMNTDWSWISEIDTKPLREYSYQEAKAKYEAWRKQKDEIRVGDEVIYHGNKYVVGYVGADEVYHIVDKNWIRVVVQGDYQIFKTGRHFDEVEDLLKKMRGGKEK